MPVMFCLQACSTMGMRYNIFGNIDIEGETTVFSDWKINTVQVYGIGKRVLWFYFNTPVLWVHCAAQE